MRTSTVVGITALAILGLYFFTQKRSAGFLHYYVQNVDLYFSGITPVLQMGLAIQNPSNTTFQVKSIVGDLISNGLKIGNVAAFGTVTVGPASVAIYPLEVRLSLIGIVSDIVKIFSGGGLQQQIEFKGAVNVNNTTAPLDFNYVIG